MTAEKDTTDTGIEITVEQASSEMGVSPDDALRAILEAQRNEVRMDKPATIGSRRRRAVQSQQSSS